MVDFFLRLLLQQLTGYRQPTAAAEISMMSKTLLVQRTKRPLINQSAVSQMMATDTVLQ